MENGRQWSSHKQRVVTGLMMSIPLIGILALAPLWTWVLLVGLIASLGLWEIDQLLSKEGASLSSLVLSIAVGLLFPLGAIGGGAAGLHIALVSGLWIGLTWLLLTAPLDSSGLPRMANLVLGWLYVPYLLAYVLLIGQGEQGRAWTFFVFILVAASDAGAFYCGRRWGRRKLYERVSPKKTIEGSLGGLLLSMVTGTLYGLVSLEGIAIWELALLSGGLALVSQVGDLVESMIKRMSGKKDSSHLIPGHGGILDRLDSLLFAFPALWVFLWWKS